MVDARALLVAQRASSLAAARGVELPDDLPLWQLAGGRPVAPAADGDPEELGELLEQVTDPARRRRLGAHFTPRATARELVDRALEGHGRPVVGDPACGGGAILLAAARRLAAQGEPRAAVVDRLWGLDVDPVAAATTEAALAIWAGAAPVAGRFRVGDALRDDIPWPPMDVVVGNPPFLSPLATTTSRSARTAERLRARYGDAVGAYTDAAALFLLQACRLAGPGATVALLQPPSVLSARDASGVRQAVAALGALTEVWTPSSAGFDAAVEVCVPVIRIGATGGHPDWSAELARAHGVPAVELPGPAVLGGLATVTAGFRGEYYGMVDHVCEHDECPGGRPLLTTGLVDLGSAAWGERRARVGGRSWSQPVVDVDALDGRAAEWVARTGGPKVVVATQTRVVELVVDDAGGYVAGVPLVVVLPAPEDLWCAAAAIASPAATAWLLHRSAGAARTPHALKVSAPLLRELPLPSDGTAWDQGARAMQAGDIDGYAVAMAAAYGVGPEVAAWWLPLARSVWSPAPALR